MWKKIKAKAMRSATVLVSAALFVGGLLGPGLDLLAIVANDPSLVEVSQKHLPPSWLSAVGVVVFLARLRGLVKDAIK